MSGLLRAAAMMSLGDVDASGIQVACATGQSGSPGNPQVFVACAGAICVGRGVAPLPEPEATRAIELF